MTIGFKCFDAGWSSLVARQAHNLKVVGSNPTPATKITNKFNMLWVDLIFKFTCFTLAHYLHKLHVSVVWCDMTEKHTILGGKVHVYKRENSPVWQCSSYLAGKNRRMSTKEKSLSKAKDFCRRLVS